MIEEILCDVVRHLLWGAWQNRCDLTCCDHATNTWSTRTRWAGNARQKKKQGTVSQLISSWILAFCHWRMNPTFKTISYQFQAHVTKYQWSGWGGVGVGGQRGTPLVLAHAIVSVNCSHKWCHDKVWNLLKHKQIDNYTTQFTRMYLNINYTFTRIYLNINNFITILYLAYFHGKKPYVH